MLENIVEISLERGFVNDYNDYSFCRKIIVLNKIHFKGIKKKKFVFSSLKTLNGVQNKLANKWNFDIKNGEFES